MKKKRKKKRKDLNVKKDIQPIKTINGLEQCI